MYRDGMQREGDESDFELEFGVLLWEDDDECIDENVDMVETQLAETAVDMFLEEPSPTLHCTPFSGISDRDAVIPGQLSPMFRLIVLGDDVSVEEIQEFEHLSMHNTPVKQLYEKLDEFASFFEASFRIQGTTGSQESKTENVDYNYETGFAVSTNLLASALYVHFRNVGQSMKAWRGMQVEATSAQFNSNRLPHVYLKDLEVRTNEDDPEMKDPLTGCEYDIKCLCHVDTALWEISESSVAFPLPRNPKLVHKFGIFLIPASITMETMYNHSLQGAAPCGMVHFSMPEQIQAELMRMFPSNMSDEETRYFLRECIQFFTSNCHVIAKEMEAVLQGKTLREYFHRDKANASIQIKHWFSMLKERILAFINHKRDGDMYIGTGRILAWNDCMLAHSISAFSGSSGAAVFLLGGVAGCHVGIHLSPASVRITTDKVWHVIPDHNLACNTENPVYGKMYFEHVLSSIKLCDNDIRRDVLKRYLGYHLSSILRNYPCEEWTTVQTTWMRETISYLADAPKKSKGCRLDLLFEAAEKGEVNQEEYICEGWKDLCKIWLRSMMEAGSHCIEMLGAQNTMQKWRAIVDGAVK